METILISYPFANKEIKKKVAQEDTHATLLVNKKGSYFLHPLSDQFSNYQGLYYARPTKDEWELFKLIDRLSTTNSITKIIKRPKSISFEGRFTEKYTLLEHENILVYEAEHATDHHGFLDLDMRPIYDFSVEGRLADFEIINGEILVYEHQGITLAIKPSCFFKLKDEWVKRDYAFDYKRQESHAEWYVHRRIEFNFEKKNKIIFSFADDKQKAIDALSRNIKELVLKQELYEQECINKFMQNKFDDLTCYKTIAKSSLDNLYVAPHSVKGIYAGLPWFFQFWSRDEALSVKPMFDVESTRKMKEFFFNRLDILKDGRISNRTPKSLLSSADGVGWMFFALRSFLDYLKQKKLYDLSITTQDKEKIKELLIRSIELLEQNYLKQGLIQNTKDETWMDTTWGNDDRDGACIEIQALMLNMYKFAYEMTQNQMYQEKEHDLKVQTLLDFYTDNVLCDRAHDKTSRPNIFLAWRAYPELLENHEWQQAFDHAIETLWCDWGGFSTIDKSHPLYTEYYSGQNNKSYHRGDSWFFVNNIAAQALITIDSSKYFNQIKAVLEASTLDLAWRGFLGYSSEVSSAHHFDPNASLAQAWSLATYVELIEELQRKGY